MGSLVAEKVLGWTAIRSGDRVLYISPDKRLCYAPFSPFITLDISRVDCHALELVVPALQKRGWLVVIKAMADGHYFRTNDVEPLTINLPFACETHWQPGGGLDNQRRRIHGRQTAFGATMAEAICRAALLAVDAEKKKF